MKILSASDASMLARVAGNRDIARNERSSILQNLSSENAKQLAHALLGDSGVSVEANTAARAVQSWTKRQKGHRTRSGKRMVNR